MTTTELDVDVATLSLFAADHFPAGIEQFWTKGMLTRWVRSQEDMGEAVETELQLDELVATQDVLSRAGLWTAYRGQPDFQRTRWPIIIRMRGKLCVWDGHHRLAIRRARGYRSMICGLYEAR